MYPRVIEKISKRKITNVGEKKANTQQQRVLPKLGQNYQSRKQTNLIKSQNNFQDYFMKMRSEAVD